MISWPTEWGLDEGWPKLSARETPLVASETRTWKGLNHTLRRIHGTRLSLRIEVLDGPAPKDCGTPMSRSRQARITAGRGTPAAPEKEVRRRIQGLTRAEYNQKRRSWGFQYKDASLFPRHYGKSFQEVRDGRRMGDWTPADVLRPMLVGLDSFAAYVEMVQRIKINAPMSPSCFKFVYNETFCQMRDGVRFGGAQKAPEDEVRRRIQGMTIPEYEEARTRWNATKGYRRESPFFVSAGEFPRVYGKGFMELRDGIRRLVPLEKLLSYIQPLAQKTYIRRREALGKKLGGVCPVPGHFPKEYGVTYGEAVGRGRGGRPLKSIS